MISEMLRTALHFQAAITRMAVLKIAESCRRSARILHQL
jgi:hypothetical protein